MLLLFFLFTFSGVMLEKVVRFLQPFSPFPGAVNSLTSLLVSTLLIAIFYRAFFPVRVSVRHILIGSFITAALWIAMRPAFSLFLMVNQSYGTIFGGMKNMFISIGWLYYSFAVFLFGTELIATMRKKEVLLLRGLFGNASKQDHADYMSKLMRQFGRTFQQGEFVFHEGAQGDAMYYLVSGRVTVFHQGNPIRELSAGEYFGEMAVLANTARTADAIVMSDEAQILSVSADNFETLLREDPDVAMTFLREMAQRLRDSNLKTEYRQ